MNRDSVKKMMGNIKRVQESVNSKNPSSQRDDTWWQPPWNEQKKMGTAVIAFLPFKDFFDDTENGEISPFIPYHTHNELIGTGGKKYWGIFCPSARPNNQEECPLCAKFFELWNEGESGKALGKALNLGRKRRYAGNIVVVKNDSNPEEVGKIFKWSFGVTIQDKILSKISPEEEDDTPIMIHNIMNPMLFRVKVKEKSGYRNFDDCEWIALPPEQKSIADYIMKDAKNKSKDEKEAWEDDNIVAKLYSVNDILPADSFRSVDELTKILNDVLTQNNIKGVSNPQSATTPIASTTVETKNTNNTLLSNDDLPFDIKKDDSSSGKDDNDLNLDEIFK